MDPNPLRLWPGEWVVWTGSPVRSTMFRPNDAFLIPFSIVWAGMSVLPTAFGVAALGQVRHAIAALPFAILCLLFGVVGVYMLGGRFVVRAFTSRRVRYVVTTKRVVVVAGRSRFQVRSGILRLLPPPVHSDAADGSGSIAFGAFPGIEIPGRRGIAFGGEPGTTPVLWHVANVREVWHIIAAAQQGVYPTPGTPPYGTAAALPSSSAAPAQLGATGRTGPRIRPGRVVLLVVLGLAVLAVYPVTLVATKKYGLGPTLTRATVTSCTPSMPVSRYSTYTCTVTWSDGTGQHSAPYSDDGPGAPAVGTVLPVRVRDGVASDGRETWMREFVATQLLVSLLAVAIIVLFARRGSAGLLYRRSTGG